MVNDLADARVENQFGALVARVQRDVHGAAGHVLVLSVQQRVVFGVHNCTTHSVTPAEIGKNSKVCVRVPFGFCGDKDSVLFGFLIDRIGNMFPWRSSVMG